MGRVGQHKRIPALLGEVGWAGVLFPPWPNLSLLAHGHLRGNTVCTSLPPGWFVVCLSSGDFVPKPSSL